MTGPSLSHKPSGSLRGTCSFLVPALSLAFSPGFAWQAATGKISPAACAHLSLNIPICIMVYSLVMYAVIKLSSLHCTVKKSAGKMKSLDQLHLLASLPSP